jgi:WhiB family redox-sensing transcriptional regulator
MPTNDQTTTVGRAARDRGATPVSLPPGRTCTRCGIVLDERTCEGGARGAPIGSPADTRPGPPRTRCDDCTTSGAGRRTATGARSSGNPLAIPREFLAREAWMDDGACVGENPETFYPTRGKDTAVAKAICAGCDVSSDCLAYALRHTIRHGIWGGTSERERRRMRAERAATVAAADGTGNPAPPEPVAATPPPTCPVCGAVPPPPGPQGGRRRIYCTDGCRQVAAARRAA